MSKDRTPISLISMNIDQIVVPQMTTALPCFVGDFFSELRSERRSQGFISTQLEIIPALFCGSGCEKGCISNANRITDLRSTMVAA
jgi:hypothetical protein